MTLSVDAPGVLANDTDTEGDALAASVVDSGPSSGSLTLNADGSFTYTPLLVSEASSLGNDFFIPSDFPKVPVRKIWANA